MAVFGVPSVAFVGHAGAGKSTAAAFLAETYGHEVVSFAAPLKKIAAELWDKPGRHELQQLGAKVREIDEDAWSNYLLRDLDALENSPLQPPDEGWPAFTVDDCRFPNEMAALQSRGFVTVRLNVPRDTQRHRLTANGKWQSEEQLDHLSETALDGFPTDFHYLNMDDVVGLYQFLVKTIDRVRR